MKGIKLSLLTVCALSILGVSCVNKVGESLGLSKSKNKSNSISNSKETNQFITDDGIDLQVISETEFEKEASNKSILSMTTPKVISLMRTLPHGPSAESISKLGLELSTQEESLLIGFPIGLIGEQNIFGGVITKVTDKKNENLGSLKLTDLSPIHVRTVISGIDLENPALTFTGCFSKCEENSEQISFVSFPIVGFNEEKKTLIVDMSTIGRELDLITMLDPKGQYTKLKAVSSDTITVDFNMKTLVFDIKTKMIPVTAEITDTTAPITEFTVRWYLKLNSASNPAFVSRAPVDAVGFFKTERGSSPNITRFSTTPTDGKNKPSIHYYIKNVPKEYQKYFSNALDSWNVEFTKIIERPLIKYEFIAQDDSRAKELVTGDIRYNIIEWDLDNVASYGGLGPSIANQYTGETMSANILVQGPTIIEMYSAWYGVSQKAKDLIATGMQNEANQIMKEFNGKVAKDIENRNKIKFIIKLGKHLEMNVHSQKTDLEDPLYKGHFELVPNGVTYSEYMEGYFEAMLAHELGHNLGLRHNFKGSLGAYENSSDKGSVSRSIMEYLARGHRHLSGIGPYDRMAIAYGYKGVTPTKNNWFCTDEDQGSNLETLKMKSPECTKSDATSDPFSYWESRIVRSIDMLLETKSNTVPVWAVKEIAVQIDEAVVGLSAYALSAEATSATWTNFFGKNDRPEKISEIKPYVLAKLRKRICNPKLKEIIAQKETPEASKIAQTNLEELVAAIVAKTKTLELYEAKDFECEK